MTVTLAPPSTLRRPISPHRDSREAERELLVCYHRSGDLEAREELVQRFLPLARELRCATPTPTSPSTTCSRSPAWA